MTKNTKIINDDDFDPSDIEDNDNNDGGDNEDSEMALLLNSEKYIGLKKLYQEHWFKLRGHYCHFDHDTVREYTVAEISEEFINKRISISHDIEEKKVNKKTGNVVTTINSKKFQSHSFKYGVWIVKL